MNFKNFVLNLYRSLHFWRVKSEMGAKTSRLIHTRRRSGQASESMALLGLIHSQLCFEECLTGNNSLLLNFRLKNDVEHIYLYDSI